MRFGGEQQTPESKTGKKVSDITATINHVNFIGGQFNLISVVVWWNLR
jgi:hypothetical protein